MKNFLLALCLTLAMSPILLISDAVSVVLRHPGVRQALHLNHRTVKVEGFAYNQNHSAQTINSLSRRNYSSLTLDKVPGSENATAAMPVYLYTGHLRTNGLPRNARILFFGTNDGYFRALNMDSGETAWSLPLPRGLAVNSSAVMSVEKNKIYFLANSKEPKFNPRLFVTSIDGQHIDSMEIAQSSCESPLGLKLGNKSFVYFNCNSNLIFVPLKVDGSFDTNENPITVENTRGVPSILPDTSLLVETSIGQHDLQAESFGCCTIHLNGNTLHPEDSPASFCLDSPEFSECPYMNEDSGGVFSVNTSTAHPYAFRAGENGKLYTFSPEHLSASSKINNGMSIHLGDSLSALVPTYSTATNEARAFVVSTTQAHSKQEHFVLSTRIAAQRFLIGHKELACIGFIHRSGGTKEMALMYSGPYRDIFLNLKNGSELFQKFRNDNFVSVASLGEAFYSRQEAPSGYFYSPLSTLEDPDGKFFQFPYSYAQAREQFSTATKFKVHSDNLGYILMKAGGEKNDFCGDLHDDSLVPLYLYRQLKEQKSSSWTLHSFRVNPDHSLYSRWNYRNESPGDQPNKFPIVIQTQSQNSAIYATVISNQINGSSELMLFDDKDGVLLQSIPFQGDAQKVMPLMVDEEILLATGDVGILRFSRTHSLGEIIRQRSYFFWLWKNIFAKLGHI